MITIRDISKNKNELNDRIRITTTIKSIAINFKDFYDMDYIRFHSGRHSSRFKLTKRNGIIHAPCKKSTLWGNQRWRDVSLHDYKYTTTDLSIPALSKYYERYRRS